MRKPRATERQSGFTLIEVLVSLVIIATIAGASYLCLQAGLESERTVAAAAGALQNARVALDLITRDLRAASPLDEEFEFVGADRELDGAEADNLDFATRNWNPQLPGEADFAEISYYVRRDPRSGELALWRRRDPTPDGEPFGGGIHQEIVRGIRSFRLEYYDGFYWYDTWGKQVERVREETARTLAQSNLRGLPDAVRVTLVLSAREAQRRSGGSGARESGARDGDSAIRFTTAVFLPLAGRVRTAGTEGSTAGSGDAASTNEGARSR